MCSKVEHISEEKDLNVYFIYNFNNAKNAKKKIEELKEKHKSVFYFDNDKDYKHWKLIAKKEIKKCDLVKAYLYQGNKKTSNKNIEYEKRLAKRYKKDIEYMDCNDYQTLLSETLDGKGASKETILKEYELMLSTTESLEDRRQKTSSLYVSIIATLITLVGASFAIKNLVISSILCIITGLLITLLNWNWWKSLKRLHDMNNVKFLIIEELEEMLSLCSFKAEYQLKKAEKMPSYKDRENRLNIIFLIAGLLILITGIVILVLSILNIVKV